jgi:hypothetical protein
MQTLTYFLQRNVSDGAKRGQWWGLVDETNYDDNIQLKNDIDMQLPRHPYPKRLLTGNRKWVKPAGRSIIVTDRLFSSKHTSAATRLGTPRSKIKAFENDDARGSPYPRSTHTQRTRGEIRTGEVPVGF